MQPVRWSRTLALACFVILLVQGTPGLARGQASLHVSGTGFGIGLGHGEIDGRTAAGIHLDVAIIATYGLATSTRPLAFGNVVTNLALEAWSNIPTKVLSADLDLLWRPHVGLRRLRPYLGMGGGAVYEIEELPYASASRGPSPKVSAVAGISYRAGWETAPVGRTPQEATWLLEVRVGRSFGSVSQNEVVFRQGFLWSAF